MTTALEPRFWNVAAHLPDLAARQPDRLAVVCPAGRDAAGRAAHTHLTFAQLDRDSGHAARQLAGLGVGRGTRTVLMVPPSLEFFTLTFALFKIGAVPVLIDPGMGVRRLGPCLAQASPEAFVGTPKAQLARRVLGWGRATVRVTIAVGRSRMGAKHLYAGPRVGAAVRPFPPAEVQPGELAAVLFTSGSTGPAKGVEYTHGMFAYQVEALRALFDIRPGECDLATFPLFALFGPALGMTAVVPEMDPTRPAKADPRKIIAAVADFGVNNLFGSPALLDRLSRYCAARQIVLPQLARVTSAGAPVPAAVVERCAGFLAGGARVHTPYGATECLPVACIDSGEILGETRALTARGAGVCVGRPVAGLRAAIVPTTDGAVATWDDNLALPPGRIGEIVVNAPWASPAYFARPDATALAKIPDPAGGFWHRMGDLGYFDAGGRLWFCGRKSERVELAGGMLYTAPTEAVFDAHPAVLRSALVGVRRGGATHPVVCVELEKPAPERRRVRDELLALAAASPHTRPIKVVLFHPAFPVDVRHNAKIFRGKLAAWAARKLAWRRLPEPGPVAPPPVA